MKIIALSSEGRLRRCHGRSHQGDRARPEGWDGYRQRGTAHLAAGANEEALSCLRNAVATEKTNFNEYRMAKAIVARMGEKKQP
jgi:hypothetical protein